MCSLHLKELIGLLLLPDLLLLNYRFSRLECKATKKRLSCKQKFVYDKKFFYN